MKTCLEQFLRCYTEPIGEEMNGNSGLSRQSRTRNPSEEELAINEIGRPYDGHCLVFDTETTSDAAQVLRFGMYTVYGLDSASRVRLYRRDDLTRELLDVEHSAGIFYNPATCTESEIGLLREYAAGHTVEGGYPWQIMTVEAFIRDVFYEWVYSRQALCIGHNLAFDLSRLATSWGKAQKRYSGGFWLKLCSCERKSCFDHPAIRIKHIGPQKNMIEFRHESIPDDKKRNKTTFYGGTFLDTGMFGRALLGPGDATLRGMGKRFKASVIKADDAEHGVTLCAEYLDYARQDVAATWALYQAERALYRTHGLSRDMWRIYSEASLGKAYLQELGVPQFMNQNAAFPKDVLGFGMVAYYGGRTEVKIRLQPTEVVYCDFKSQYPTVNALMGLQDLLLAKQVKAKDCTAKVRDWLTNLTMDDLQQPESWRHLRCLVKVRPDGDILPVRARYGGGDDVAACNIGVSAVTGPPVWYALPDVVASVLLAGKVPEILEAVEFVPVGSVKSNAWALFGDERYAVDLDKQDFFTEVINLRTRVQADMSDLTEGSDEWEHLDGLQRALKLLANSTSYGVLLEIIQDERTERAKPVMVYGTDQEQRNTHVVERPGPYFAGPIGALIPAAGRLLIAIAERLAADRGLSYGFCDTDSMAFSRPPGVDRETFHELTSEIIEWFTPLSPYREPGSILQQEKINRWEGKPEPLYFLGISPKRYVLYNRMHDGRYRIRKFSAHGTGTWDRPGEYQSRVGIPEPAGDVYKLGGARWLYDLWYEAIENIEAGETDHVPATDYPPLNLPAMGRATITTWNLYQQYQSIDGMRPFNFITTLPGLGRSFDIEMLAGAWEEGVNLSDAITLQDMDGIAAQSKSERRLRSRAAREDWKELGGRIRHEGGIRRTADVAGEFIPPSIVRKGGLPADVMAAQFGYSYTHEFLEHVRDVHERQDYQHGLSAFSRDNPYATIKPATTFYAPRGSSFADVKGKVRRSDGKHQQVNVRHRILGHVLMDYFQARNHKMEEPRGIGILTRRQVEIIGHTFIGKETNEIMEELEEDTDGVIGYRRVEDIYGHVDVSGWLMSTPVKDVMKRAGLARQTIYDLRNGATPTPATLKKLQKGMSERPVKLSFKERLAEKRRVQGEL